MSNSLEIADKLIELMKADPAFSKVEKWETNIPDEENQKGVQNVICTVIKPHTEQIKEYGDGRFGKTFLYDIVFSWKSTQYKIHEMYEFEDAFNEIIKNNRTLGLSFVIHIAPGPADNFVKIGGTKVTNIGLSLLVSVIV